MKNQLSNIKQSILHSSLTSTISYTKFNFELVQILFKNGLITHYKKVYKKNKLYFRIFLRYYETSNVIRDIRPLYKSRRLRSTSDKNFKKIQQSLLVSTSKGLMLQSDLKTYSIGGNVFYFINC
jgi:ribosomal protein S8